MEIPEPIRQLAAALNAAGHEVLLAGGCVRDAFLHRPPKDYDLATSARPDQVLKVFPRGLKVGAHFGVIIVPTEQGPIDVATFRTDGSYSDGRRPDVVEFATAEEDAQRRDFTINGLFVDPLTGELRDYVGGKADLDQRLIRAIGDADRRFEEDHLRLMRAIRQAVELEFEIEPTTWRAIQKHAHQIAKVSVERVRDELNRILRSPHRVRGFDLLVESGLMAVILPEILDLQGCEQPPQFHPEGDVYVHTRLMLSHLEPDASLTLVLSVLLHDIAKPATRSWDETAGRARFNGHDALGAEMAETILRRLKYPNEVIHAVVDAVAVHMRFIHIQDLRVAKLKRFLARPNFEEELALHRVDCLGSNGRLENYEFVREKQEEFSQQPLVPPRLITGADLIARGWQPSAMFRDILEQVETLQLEGSLKDRDSALAWLDALPHAEPR